MRRGQWEISRESANRPKVQLMNLKSGCMVAESNGGFADTFCKEKC